MDLKSKIHVIEDFPEKGISFKDITTLLNDADAFKQAVDEMIDYLKDKDITKIVGPEARGFFFGAPVAYAMGLPFVPIRKVGKLPRETEQFSYDLEYGTDSIEVHKEDIHEGDKIAIIDDLLATGGTVNATAHLIEKLGGTVNSMCFLIELTDLKGREVNKGYDIKSLVQYNI